MRPDVQIDVAVACSFVIVPVRSCKGLNVSVAAPTLNVADNPRNYDFFVG